MSHRELSRVFERANELLKAGKRFAIVSIVEYKGHSARHEGAMMIVAEDGSIVGTVGGSALERFSIERALDDIRSGKNEFIDIPATSELGMSCGGSVKLFIKVVGVPDYLVIFGAGHIAYELSKIASGLGYRVIIVDDRPEFANRERFPEAHDIIVARPKDAVERIPEGENVYVALMSYSADVEQEALEALLAKNYRYIGVIASPVKTLKYLDSLSTKYSLDRLAQIRAPMGLDIGGGEEPVDIALSIIAEIQMVRHGATGRPLNRVPELLEKIREKKELKAQ